MLSAGLFWTSIQVYFQLGESEIINFLYSTLFNLILLFHEDICKIRVSTKQSVVKYEDTVSLICFSLFIRGLEVFKP